MSILMAMDIVPTTKTELWRVGPCFFYRANDQRKIIFYKDVEFCGHADIFNLFADKRICRVPTEEEFSDFEQVCVIDPKDLGIDTNATDLPWAD